MTVESFLEGHVRAFEWLGGRVRLRQPELGRRRREGEVVAGPSASRICAATTPSTRPPATPREKGSVEGAARYLKHRLLAAAALFRPRRAGRRIRALAR